VEDQLRGKPPQVIELFQRFMAAVDACGPVDVRADRKVIVLHGSKRIFGSVRMGKDGLRGHLNLPYHVDDRRFPLVEPLTRQLYFHRFLLRELAELDDRFVGWIGEAYEVGQGKYPR
jgi:hypothetical protein